MSIGVVIPAAGQGKRMNRNINKQFIRILDRPVLAHTLSVFINNNKIDQINVVVHPDEITYVKENITSQYLDHRIKIITGGRTRRESVYAGLKSFSPVINYVIIHDGARPLLTQVLLNKIIKSLKSHDAITVGTKMKDTVKLMDRQGNVKETLERGNLRAIQTPQAFLYDLIMEAHRKVPQDQPVTDDASLLEYMDEKIKIIEGPYDNIKITTPLDLVIAENILRDRKRG